MRRKIYRAVAVATAIACSVLVFCTWYVVGIVEKNNTKKILEARVSSISEIMYKQEAKYKNMSELVSDEYKTKARAVAIMLSKNTDIMTDELLLEEMRMSIGADAISIFDKYIQLEYSTSMDKTSEKYVHKFEQAINNKLFSVAQIDTNYDIPKVIVGCSRLDNPGIVLIEYTAENMNVIVELINSISEMAVTIPIMKTGSLAVIDSNSMNYIAHTDENMIGKSSGFQLDTHFVGKVTYDFFDCEINGKDVLLHFDFCNNNVVIGYIPYSEIYNVRNNTIQWVIVVGAIVAIVVTLTLRSKVLHVNKKK